MATVEECVDKLSIEQLKKMAAERLQEIPEEIKQLILDINYCNFNESYIAKFKARRKELSIMGVWDSEYDEYYAKAIKGELFSR